MPLSAQISPKAKAKWRTAALILLVLAATGLALGYVIQTPFYQYLEQVNPANHRH